MRKYKLAKTNRKKVRVTATKSYTLLHVLNAQGNLVITPSTENQIATIDLKSLDNSILQELLRKLTGGEDEKYKIDLVIAENEAIRPEARKRVKVGNILNSST